MRGKFPSLIIVTLLTFIGTQDELLARGRWRRCRCQPTPACWCPPAPLSFEATLGRTSFRDPKGTIHWVIDSGEIDVFEAKERAESEKLEARTPEGGRDKKWDGSDGETFCKTSRRAAKTSVAHGENRTFDTFQQFHDWLPTQKHMEDLDIPGGFNSNRVREERYDVTIVAYLYAAAKQSDNDFHLIIGGGPGAPTADKMNVEISGLPPSGYPDRAVLLDARSAFKEFCIENWGSLPRSSYKYCQPPLQIRITGSIFFDIEHGPGDVGPGSLSGDIDTSWEIHPITHFEVSGN